MLRYASDDSPVVLNVDGTCCEQRNRIQPLDSRWIIFYKTIKHVAKWTVLFVNCKLSITKRVSRIYNGRTPTRRACQRDGATVVVICVTDSPAINGHSIVIYENAGRNRSVAFSTIADSRHEPYRSDRFSRSFPATGAEEDRSRQSSAGRKSRIN